MHFCIHTFNAALHHAYGALLVVLNYEKRESLTVQQGNDRAHRADEAATVALVCVERPRHNNWFMDSSAP